jgi:hypothetical protein
MVNVCYNASWALFSPLEPKKNAHKFGFISEDEEDPKLSREFTPFIHYGKTFSSVLPKD